MQRALILSLFAPLIQLFDSHRFSGCGDRKQQRDEFQGLTKSAKERGKSASDTNLAARLASRPSPELPGANLGILRFSKFANASSPIRGFPLTGSNLGALRRKGPTRRFDMAAPIAA